MGFIHILRKEDLYEYFIVLDDFYKTFDIHWWKILIWNPVFIWFQSFVFESSWLSSSCYNNKKTQCANTCPWYFRQTRVVINFNQFHCPLESCHEWNLSQVKIKSYSMCMWFIYPVIDSRTRAMCIALKLELL